MERDINQTSLCRGGCGFYGSPQTDGLCSQCFKANLKRKQDVNRLSPTSASQVSAFIPEPQKTTFISSSGPPFSASESYPVSDFPEASTSQGEKDAAISEKCDVPSASEMPVAAGSADGDSKKSEESSPDSYPQKKKNRCHQCNKKVGLTGFECRCGGLFCGVHRYSDMHMCSFDYKSLGAAEIRKNNPVVISEKIQKL